MIAILRKYSMHIYIYFFYTAVASYGPFLGFWFSEQQLSNQQIGMLFSIGPLIGLFVQPVWAILSDRYGLEKKILIVCLIFTPIFAFGYRFGDHIAIYMLSAVLIAVFATPMAPISDAMTVNHAKKYGQSYGTIRVLGSISFAIAVAPIGFFYQHIGIKYMFVFYLIAMCIVMSTVFLLEKPKIQRRPLFHGIKELFSQRTYLYFLLLTLFIMIGSHSYYVFFGVYLNHLGGNVSEKIGMLNTIAALSELPFFIYSSRLLKRYGFHLVLAVGAFAGAFRWFVLSLEPSYSILLFNQVLHGATFALFFSAGVNFAYEVSPEGAKTTGQTIFSIVYLNLANLIASNAGGWIIEQGGFSTLYQAVTVTSLCGGVGFIALNRFMKRSGVLVPLNSREQKGVG